MKTTIGVRLKSDHTKDFPNLIDRSNFNPKQKRLYPLIEQLNQTIASRLNDGENVYVIGLDPHPRLQKLRREKQSKVCKETFETAPDKGYSAVSKTTFMVTNCTYFGPRGIFHSMDLTKASVHDVHYLTEVKQSGLTTCTLLADKGYLSAINWTYLLHVR
ncbi:MAG: transposase [Bacteroidales bacterium]